MPDGFVKWYRASSTAHEFGAQVEAFSAAGISLIHPAKNVAVLLDVDGDDIEVAPARTR
jgi:hypothetical protein